MEDSSIFEALQRAGADSVDCDYEDARLDGWRTIDDLAVLADCGRSTITRLMRLSVAAGKWETKKVRLSGFRKAAAYREISADQSLQIMEPIREEKEDHRASTLVSILSREKYDQIKGVTYGVLKKSHGFTQDELDKLCAIHSDRFETIESISTAKGGRPTRRIRLK